MRLTNRCGGRHVIPPKRCCQEAFEKEQPNLQAFAHVEYFLFRVSDASSREQFAWLAQRGTQRHHSTCLHIRLFEPHAEFRFLRIQLQDVSIDRLRFVKNYLRKDQNIQIRVDFFFPNVLLRTFK